MSESNLIKSNTEEFHNETPHISIKAEELTQIFGFPITNALLTSSISLLLLVSLGVIFYKKVKILPNKFQNLIELIFESLLNFIDTIILNREKTEKYFPLIASIFFFILVSNWLGLLPGVGSLTYDTDEGIFPILRSPGSDLNFTLALGFIAVTSINIFAVNAIGFWVHAKKFFTLSNPINTFVGLLEFISEIARIISFSFRLFGNIFAGEVLLTIIFFLLPYFGPLPFLGLEIFVGFIQAFVFAILTTVFVSIATVDTHH